MNLARHADVLWRFRRIVLGGIVLGVLLAVLASYEINLAGGPSLTARGEETWTANSSILVTQPGFPEGRATLPGAAPGETPPADQVEFADPARLSGLADLYSRFLKTDEVLARVPGHPKAAQIEASPFQSGAGGLLLPVIQLTTNSGSREGARKLNEEVYQSLREVLAERQAANAIPSAKGTELKLIDAPKAVLLSGRKHTASILILLVCIVGAVALAHLLEGLRARHQDKALASIDPWSRSRGDSGAQPAGMHAHGAPMSDEHGVTASHHSPSNGRTET